MDRDSLRSGSVARRSKSQSRGSMQQQQQRKPFGVPSVANNVSGDAHANVVGTSSALLFDTCVDRQTGRVSDAQSALYETIDDDIIYDQGRCQWRNSSYSSSFVVVVVCVMNRSSRARFFFCSFLLYFFIFFFFHFGRVNNSSLWCATER